MSHSKHAALTTGMEKPLFQASYELNRQVVEDAGMALAGDQMRNPPTIASIVILVAIVVLAALAGNEAVVALTILVVLWIATWQLSRRWSQIMVGRLRKAGFDTALIPNDERRREVLVFADRVVVLPKGGAPETYQRSEMRKPRVGSEIMVLRFPHGAYALIPRRSLSAQRYNDLVRELTGSPVAGE